MNDLIGQLTSQLGINETQAKGGLGAILKVAQEKLSDGDFSQVSNLFGEGTTELLNAAPQTAPTEETSSLGGMFGAATAALGVDTNDLGLGNLATLASSFKDLDLDMDTVMKFAPLVTNWAKENGNDTVKELLRKVLG